MMMMVIFKKTKKVAIQHPTYVFTNIFVFCLLFKSWNKGPVHVQRIVAESEWLGQQLTGQPKFFPTIHFQLQFTGTWSGPEYTRNPISLPYKYMYPCGGTFIIYLFSRSGNSTPYWAVIGFGYHFRIFWGQNNCYLGQKINLYLINYFENL